MLRLPILLIKHTHASCLSFPPYYFGSPSTANSCWHPAGAGKPGQSHTVRPLCGCESEALASPGGTQTLPRDVRRSNTLNTVSCSRFRIWIHSSAARAQLSKCRVLVPETRQGSGSRAENAPCCNGCSVPGPAEGPRGEMQPRVGSPQPPAASQPAPSALTFPA